MKLKMLYFGFILSLLAVACSSEGDEKKQKSVDEYKFQIIIGIDPFQIDQSKDRGTFDDDLANLKRVFGNRLDNFGVEDYALEYKEESKELYIGLDKKVEKSRLFRMITANADVRFYQTYKAIEILNEFYGEELQDYLLQFADKLPTEEGMVRDTMELMQELALNYFPAFPSVNYEDMETANLPYFLVALERDTSTVSKAFNDPIIKDGMPDYHDLKTMWSMTTISDNLGNKSTYYAMYCLKQPFDEEHQLSGKHIESAKYIVDEETKGHIVAVKFNLKGKEILEELTTQKSGSYLAITLQNMVVSAPIIQHPITEGEMHITGNFTKDEAEFIASIMNIGSMPFNITINNHNLGE
jgi:hypothetical protein